MSFDKENTVKRFTSKGVFPHQMAFTLLLPLRNIIFSPKKLIQRLELKSDMHVLEVGSGPGYFSVHVAKNLSKGILVLADIQKEMLNKARKRLVRKKIFNTEYYLCNGYNFNFNQNYFDRIFLVTVIGEVENKELYFQEFYRILKPEGILSISELAGDPDKMNPDEVRSLAEKVGFSFYKFYGNKKNYTINFKK